MKPAKLNDTNDGDGVAGIESQIHMKPEEQRGG